MKHPENFQETFEQLRKILKPLESNLVVVVDRADHYSLDTPYSEELKRSVFFGAVRIMKNYVAFHLMPIYAHPELLDGISPALRKRMHGKSCFNFKSINPAELKELRALSKRGFAGFQKKSMHG